MTDAGAAHGLDYGAAALTYVMVSAVLGAVFVPGPTLAAASGLLFGPLLGMVVTLGSDREAGAR